ncbi:MAG: hypothetical protein JSW66_11590 [Phycisphaerales bacterium]|nr:MAG: hypothetical protein JSW66_11590 [Phycisphaerales bacterium]
MSKRVIFLAFLAGHVFLSGPVQGGLITFSSSAVSTWSANGAEISQAFSVADPLLVDITAEAQSDFSISATVSNRSEITWTGYVLSLDSQGEATFVQGTAGSTVFGTTLYPDLWTIEFRAPEPVLPDQAVTLNFGINIPDSGPYSFTLTQNPIPEPATVFFLALGAALLLGQTPKRQ